MRILLAALMVVFAAFAGASVRAADLPDYPDVQVPEVDYGLQGGFYLRGNGLVATVMSNLGLERYLTSLGLGLERTAVGDRYVLETMRAKGFNVGGEQSGHIILSDFTTTGDGLVAALQLLAVVKEAGSRVSEICRRFDRVPQKLTSVRYKAGKPLDHKLVVQVIAESRDRLGKEGRLVIRESGTEPVIRVMAESDDAGLVDAVVDEIAATIKQVA
jgi:phosphoglucosamine mutase